MQIPHFPKIGHLHFMQGGHFALDGIELFQTALLARGDGSGLHG
jgi:hypothetical protein